MNLEELIIRIEELEDENSKLKERLKRNSRRKNIRTTKKEILNNWVGIQDECGLSVDWAGAHERCWRCGCKANLQSCHIDAPNVESKTFMWD